MSALDPKPEHRRDAMLHDLRVWQRIVGALMGGGLVAVGLWSLMAQRMDGPAVVTLVVTGAIFLLIGLVGVIPDSISAKDLISFKLSNDDRAGVEALVDRLPQAARAELANPASPLQLTEGETATESPVADAFSEAARRSLAIQKLVDEKLSRAWRAAFPRGARHEFSLVSSPDTTFDTGISIHPSGTVWVVTKLQRITEVQVRQWVGEVKTLPMSAVLVISPESPTTQALISMRKPPIIFVAFDEDVAALAKALRELVDYVDKHTTLKERASLDVAPRSSKSRLDP